MEKTFGEKRVRADFNASRSDAISNLKNGFARLMDVVKSIKNPFDIGSIEFGEVERLKNIATTELETAAMYAVKAATAKAE